MNIEERDIEQDQHDGRRLNNLSDATCVILLYDITSETSFNLVKDHLFEKIVQSMLDISRQTIMIVGNKLDLAE